MCGENERGKGVGIWTGILKKLIKNKNKKEEPVLSCQERNDTTRLTDSQKDRK